MIIIFLHLHQFLPLVRHVPFSFFVFFFTHSRLRIFSLLGILAHFFLHCCEPLLLHHVLSKLVRLDDIVDLEDHLDQLCGQKDLLLLAHHGLKHTLLLHV